MRTSEGYIVAEAYIARSGTLEYSDGKNRWIEYRPKDELERAAATWAGKPVTLDHPAQMVTADTWAQVAKGVHVDMPTVVTVEGVDYLKATLQITDKDAIAKIDAGMRQLSIGFTAEVVPTEGAHADGTRCDAVQQNLFGNHTAIVRVGRAGPQVRLLMDGAEVPVTYETEETNMSNKKDNAGQPVTEVPVIGPDGQEVMLPTWAAEMLAEYQAMKQGGEEAPAEPAAPAPAQPEPSAPAAAAEPSAPAMPEEEKEEAAFPPAAEGEPEEEEEEKSGLDAASTEELEAELAKRKAAMTEDKKDGSDYVAMARKRAKLERMAAQAGVPEEVLDSADDIALTRAFIAKRLPHAKLDGMSLEQLEAVASVAAATPNKKPSEGLIQNTIQAPRADNTDPVLEAELKFLRSQGY